ncbi:acetyl/propionyl/methylcrotonyl-CoA carboxylase subunit alpha [soil metagenome]
MPATKMFDTVLIANRGEIACRIIRTLRALGIRSIAVYSDADVGARHVGLADAAVRLGGAAAADSYLNIDRVIAAAWQHGAQAIHPGYGFLSENAAFAAACAEAGIVFVGPGVEALEVMGDKIRAKNRVIERGVPVVPGLAEPGLSDERLAAAAVEIGFPVLIKPSAGGGGKGMHVVTSEAELRPALATARREAASSFGDDTLFLERYVLTPRHIEVQVLADNDGTTVHLGERECSLQRRHQKVIEEAPSPLLDPTTRARIGQAAVDTARSVGYCGAGTVEFIVSAAAPDEFFFMEMNTRLQVEHPVTELVTGLDLVEWQLRVAAGEPLGLTQDDIHLDGHAIEARLYAEDPRREFLPTGGRVLELREPTGAGIRVDSALELGVQISSDYDPMIAKIIAWAPDRAEALRRLDRALADTVTLGVTTNAEFLRLLLADPAVVAGDLDTGLIERRTPELAFRDADDEVFMAAAHAIDADERGSVGDDPWFVPRGWRIGAHAPSRFRLRVDGDTREIAITDEAAAPHGIVVHRDGARTLVAQDGASWDVVEQGRARPDAGTAGVDLELRSPMPGAVVALHVADGATVEPGEPVASVEAMKMEHVLRAATRGKVVLRAVVGEQVTADQVVASIEPEPAEEEA